MSPFGPNEIHPWGRDIREFMAELDAIDAAVTDEDLLDFAKEVAAELDAGDFW